jgi:hypothetical protein
MGGVTRFVAPLSFAKAAKESGSAGANYLVITHQTKPVLRFSDEKRGSVHYPFWALNQPQPFGKGLPFCTMWLSCISLNSLKSFTSETFFVHKTL